MKRQTKITLILCLVVMMLFGMGSAAFAAEQLDMPTNLVWNPQDRGNLDVKYGTMGWDLVDNCEGEYDIVLYKDGEWYNECGWSNVYDDGSGKTAIDMVDFFMESGTYYFTVQAIGDGVNYTDSEVAVSDEWVYVRPAKTLKTPNGLVWNGNAIYWYGPVETDCFMTTYYCDGFECSAAWGSFPYDESLGMYYDDDEEWIQSIFDDCGPGEYTFTVQALSKDITTIANSEISGHSTVKDVAGIGTSVSSKTNTLVESLRDGASASDVREELLDDVDTDDLAAAMVTNDSVLANVAYMEDSYEEEMGISVSVDVTNDVQAQGVSPDISIIGAALNAEMPYSKVKFNISKPAEDYYFDKLQYKNTVFVDMNLTNVELNDDGSLKVPVYITMPVPDNVYVPDRFRILHYRYSDDEYEVIHPVLNKAPNGTWYASFSLTHFSPFAFAEEVDDSAPAGVKGDVNLDEEVNMDDVVALLNHVVKAETIDNPDALAAGEVTNDAELNMDDVVKLLNYVVKAIDSLD